ncbi:MAG: FeoA domain-containing protein [Candidatus Aenigmarchaeota archaeon]|nr:FeoA domain-containing protein [Candidatus Aenigmarchaeota archaeon]
MSLIVIYMNYKKNEADDEISLLDMKPGYATIKEIRGGIGMRQRLTKMGIQIDEYVRKLPSRIGPCLVEVKGSQIAIGRGIANKIIMDKNSYKKTMD